MTDIQIAKVILEEENLSLVAVKNGEVIFKSKDKGIKPLYTLAIESKEKAKNASLADRVIGKGAAILCGYIGIKEVYVDLISEDGMNTLDKYEIPFTMKKTCPYIKNRDKTDYCPIENLSMDLEDPLLLIDKIRGFFASLNPRG